VKVISFCLILQKPPKQKIFCQSQEVVIMRSSIYTVGLASFILSIFSGTVQADGVTYVKLSTAPIVHVNTRVHYVHPRRVCPQQVCVSRVQNKHRVKTSYAKRIHKIRVKKLRAQRKAKARKRVLKVKTIRRNLPVRYYYVQNGDSLYKIAKKCNVSVKHILRVNNLKSSVINAGIRLKI